MFPQPEVLTCSRAGAKPAAGTPFSRVLGHELKLEALHDLSPSWRRIILVLFVAACTVVVVSGARAISNVLNPVLMAGFLALLLQPLLHRLRRLGGFAVAIVVLFVVLGGLALLGFVGVSLRQLALELPRYYTELQTLLDSITRQLADRGINAAAYVESALTGPAVAGTVLDISGAVAGGFGNLVLTLFIFAFMLGGMWELERRASRQALDHSPLAARFLTFAGTIRSYMAVRSVLGLGTALLNYLLLLIIGVEYALLWAVLSFLLSFVPNIGFALSMLPPMLLALLGKGWVSALAVFAGYQVINTLLDNVIGPRFIGRQMKISPLLSFLSVIFWAWVLGPTGAILAVPLTVFIQDLAFGPTDRPDLGEPQPVTHSTLPAP
ncbi:MAG TPA: AI-2E family transporter [Longimicrobiales bacterium]|nr:AI-2E family transporter [Longimicrobiales bacterium]